MHIFYITNHKLPTHKANGYQIVKTIEALKRKKIKVTLIIPKRKNNIPRSIKTYYNLSSPIKTIYLPTVDLLHIKGLSIFPYYLQTITFYLSLTKWSLSQKSSSTIFTRDWPAVLYLNLTKSKYKIILEIHQLPTTKLGLFLLKIALSKVKQVVSTNPLLTKDLSKLTSTPINTIPNSADPKHYRKISGSSLKTKLKLPVKKFIVTYTGNLQTHKGINTLIQSSELLDSNVLILVIGGSNHQIKSFKSPSEGTNIKFLSHKLPNQISQYQQAADALVIPNSSKNLLSSHYTSPIKLFEYFHAQRPIIASNTPSIKQFAQNSVLYFKADNPKDLAQKINTLSKNKKLQKQLVKKTNLIKSQYTYSFRAKKIISLLNQM